VVDSSNQLHPRKVEVLHRAKRKVWVGEGLKDGERVCTTPIEIISEGMKVRVIGDKQVEEKLIPTGQNSESNTSAQ
jgi:hypothetical protein